MQCTCRLTVFDLQVAEEIWVCEKQTVTKWEGDIYAYKQALIKMVNKELAKKQ